MKKASQDGSALGVHFAAERHGFLRRWRCILGIFLALLVAAGIRLTSKLYFLTLLSAAILICIGVFAYLRAEALKRTKAEDAQYLKRLVNAVNNGKDARWKVRGMTNPNSLKRSIKGQI